MADLNTCEKLLDNTYVDFYMNFDGIITGYVSEDELIDLFKSATNYILELANDYKYIDKESRITEFEYILEIRTQYIKSLRTRYNSR